MSDISTLLRRARLALDNAAAAHENNQPCNTLSFIEDAQRFIKHAKAPAKAQMQQAVDDWVAQHKEAAV